MKPIYLRNVPPPLETFEHVNMLEWYAAWIRPERYLELGVRDGKCFIPVSEFCTEAIAVDSAPRPFPLNGNMAYHEMYTDEYFESIKGQNLKFDMVFIDADHSHEQSYKDFLNVKDLVVPDGFVFFHDTYPCNEELTQAHFCNDCYKTPIAIKENFSDEWEVVTLPFNPGVTICKKARKDNKLPWM
jgi:hypothetical protein